jgi:hypothetical protein
VRWPGREGGKSQRRGLPVLVARWRADERTRLVVEQVAREGRDAVLSAVNLLASHWKGERTRQVLEVMFKERSRAAFSALEWLLVEWKDDRTRRMVEETARRTPLGAGNALCALAKEWPDGRTREVLEVLCREGKADASLAAHLLGSLPCLRCVWSLYPRCLELLPRRMYLCCQHH